MKKEYYIGLMSGTSMDGVDAVLIQMQERQWLGTYGHAFLQYPDDLKKDLLDLQPMGLNELHRSRILAQRLSYLYADVVNKLLLKTNISSNQITAIGCHGQTVRHNPEQGYSVQLADWALLAAQTQILTVGDFRSGDLAVGGQGAPLVPAFHKAVFYLKNQTTVVLNIGGIANISVLSAQQEVFGFDTGAGNMLMDAWVQFIWQMPYDVNGEKSQQGQILPKLLAQLCAHPYFQQKWPKSTGRELFSLTWLQQYLNGDENPYDVLRTLLVFTVGTIVNAIMQAAPDAYVVYACGGGVANHALMNALKSALSCKNIQLETTAVFNLDPQQVEAAAFAWLASCWVHRIASNPMSATGAKRSVILGAGYYY